MNWTLTREDVDILLIGDIMFYESRKTSMTYQRIATSGAEGLSKQSAATKHRLAKLVSTLNHLTAQRRLLLLVGRYRVGGAGALAT